MHRPRRQPPKNRRPRPYHLADDTASLFDYELPDWLVGANKK